MHFAAASTAAALHLLDVPSGKGGHLVLHGRAFGVVYVSANGALESEDGPAIPGPHAQHVEHAVCANHVLTIGERPLARFAAARHVARSVATTRGLGGALAGAAVRHGHARDAGSSQRQHAAPILLVVEHAWSNDHGCRDHSARSVLDHGSAPQHFGLIGQERRRALRLLRQIARRKVLGDTHAFLRDRCAGMSL